MAGVLQAKLKERVDAQNSGSAEAQPVGRRAQSRARILTAARKLFVEKGYHATRPQDIMREAGLGHGTFYLHFQDKQECFMAFVAEASTELLEAISKTAEEHGPDAPLGTLLRDVLLATRAYNDSHPGVLEAALSDPGVIAAENAPSRTVVDDWADLWGVGLADMQAEGRIRSDLDPVFMGYMFVGMFRSLANFAARQDGADAEEKTIEQLVAFIETAIEAKEKTV